MQRKRNRQEYSLMGGIGLFKEMSKIKKSMLQEAA
jgi:hypothetical protein